jgi:hypothetical protein
MTPVAPLMKIRMDFRVPFLGDRSLLSRFRGWSFTPSQRSIAIAGE